MTLIKPEKAEEPDISVGIAEDQSLEALIAVAEVTRKIQAQELDALQEVPKVAAHATAARKQLLAEKDRVYEQQKRKSGVVNDFAIDFDAARAEIGRRLACLRAARDG
ncbi:hypothetical protein P1J78_09415 [Psychromarinibacter sp. C21-152]|uniref:Uncharacterized protein n=1 Tax=Psychromarinibacter sediminicola TaxID=3033385 RepID=A0AAE3NUP4_9RHOB|nr:hypothetical protein [Psychromarinibacter sediminicola]MDF0600947.1 hypothetical protein [Psychromarinibacter sediminicola]